MVDALVRHKERADAELERLLIEGLDSGPGLVLDDQGQQDWLDSMNETIVQKMMADHGMTRREAMERLH